MAKIETPAIHIPREHQSAPAETWADKEVRLATEEITSGQFQPTVDPDNPLDSLSVGVQRGIIPSNPNQIDMGSLHDSELLLQHPRVQEALARLEQERDDSKNSQEYLEKSQMLHELNANAMKANQWDGQQRWIGKDNEEMRYGTVLSPFEFMVRLERVIGTGRVQLNRFAVHKRVALMAPDRQEKRRILLPGEPEPSEDGLLQVGTLQYPLSTEWMIIRFDEYGVPTTAKFLGWRTALLSMISLGVISEKEAHKAFPLAQNRTIVVQEWYREQLHALRAKNGEVN